MANPEHLAILKQGVEGWNKWREEHSDLRPNLREAELEGADLSGALLQEADLYDANLVQASLSATELYHAYLHGANLSGAHLLGAKLHGANLHFTDFSGAKLRGAELTYASLISATLLDADVSGANLYLADLRYANSLGRTSTLRFSRSKSHQRDLSGAEFSGARYREWRFGDVDLSAAKGLDTVQHEGPSKIGIDTIYRSKGKIPDVFLRGCGVPDEFIAYIGSMVGRPIEFYSCFISYSTKDQEFAERLHADLQAKGVRCWFAPHDIRAGGRFTSRSTRPSGCTTSCC